MAKDIEKLIEIAEFVNSSELLSELYLIKDKVDVENPEILVPLVGVYSTGKTSLINTLMDNPCLEEDNDPTTSSIFEIRFNQSENYALIKGKSGDVNRIESPTLISNSMLDGTETVQVYDKSSRVPKSLVLVDTPGLASDVEKHREALVSYIPNADAILLTININQAEISAALEEFSRTLNVGKKPIYIVLTKSDYKTPSAVKSIRENLANNCLDIPQENIIVTSAKKGDLSELQDVFLSIQKNKQAIISNSVNQRLEEIGQKLYSILIEMSSLSQDENVAEQTLKELEKRLDRYDKNIDELISSAADIIADNSYNAKLDFVNSIKPQLRTIVKDGNNYEVRVHNAVVSTAAEVLKSYKDQVKSSVIKLAIEKNRSGKELPMDTIRLLDLSQVVFNDCTFTQNVSLDNIGHENDRAFTIASKATLAVSAAIIVIASGGSAAPAVAEGAAASSAAAGTAAASAGGAAAHTGLTLTALASGADTATDIISIKKSNEAIKKAEQTRKEMALVTKKLSAAKADKENKSGKAAQAVQTIVEKTEEMIPKVEEKDTEYGEKLGFENGVIGGIVYKIAEKSAFQERLSVIDHYVSNTLAREISDAIDSIDVIVLSSIASLMKGEATESINEARARVSELKLLKQSNSVSFKDKLKTINNYIEYLQ